MGLLSPFYHIWDTVCFIREHGWEEYKEARKRYDNHMRLTSYGDARFNKKNYIKQLNQAKRGK